MPKHGTPRSKLPGTEARADRKNRTSPRLHDSGSESESESSYETDSDSDTNEGPSCEGKSHGLSNVASTSESSCNDSLPKDSDKHTKFRISDALSCLTSQQSDITTDEYILPNTSITQSPPAQVMDRNTGPDSSFCSKSCSATGSADSVESLFSLRINSNSFTNHIFKAGAILESEDFFQTEELESSSMNKSGDLLKLRQPSFEARVPNISIGKTIASKYVDHDEELIVSEELPLAAHPGPTSHQNEFVLPLTFPKSKELMNKNNKTKKKKKGACQFCFCCKCPSCSLKCLSCSGCCTCPTFRSCCCQLPSCCKCSSCSCCCKCSCKSIWSFWGCK